LWPLAAGHTSSSAVVAVAGCRFEIRPANRRSDRASAMAAAATLARRFAYIVYLFVQLRPAAFHRQFHGRPHCQPRGRAQNPQQTRLRRGRPEAVETPAGGQTSRGSIVCSRRWQGGDVAALDGGRLTAEEENERAIEDLRTELAGDMGRRDIKIDERFEAFERRTVMVETNSAPTTPAASDGSGRTTTSSTAPTPSWSPKCIVIGSFPSGFSRDELMQQWADIQDRMSADLEKVKPRRPEERSDLAHDVAVWTNAEQIRIASKKAWCAVERAPEIRRRKRLLQSVYEMLASAAKDAAGMQGLLLAIDLAGGAIYASKQRIVQWQRDRNEVGLSMEQLSGSERHRVGQHLRESQDAVTAAAGENGGGRDVREQHAQRRPAEHSDYDSGDMEPSWSAIAACHDRMSSWTLGSSRARSTCSDAGGHAQREGPRSLLRDTTKMGTSAAAGRNGGDRSRSGREGPHRGAVHPHDAEADGPAHQYGQLVLAAGRAYITTSDGFDAIMDYAVPPEKTPWILSDHLRVVHNLRYRVSRYAREHATSSRRLQFRSASAAEASGMDRGSSPLVA